MSFIWSLVVTFPPSVSLASRGDVNEKVCTGHRQAAEDFIISSISIAENYLVYLNASFPYINACWCSCS